MKPWNHVMRDAREIHHHREDFAYLYGANGECPKTFAEAQALVNELWSIYPDHFQKYVIEKGHTKTELIWHIVGKICYDCSSFICAITQSEGDIYHLRVTKDMNSTMLHNACPTHTSVREGRYGSLLWRNGHVGVDVANGYAIDFAAEFVDCREYRCIDPDSPTTFTDSSEMPWVDYTGSINL